MTITAEPRPPNLPPPSGATRGWRPVLFLAIAGLIYAANTLLARRVGTEGPVPEWLVGIDLLLTVPVLYIVLMRPTWRQGLLGVAAALSVGILVGACIIPAADKHAWLWLERLRWVGLGGLLLMQAVLLARVVAALWHHRRAANLEAALHAAISRVLGVGVGTRLVQADARLWLYLLRRQPRLAWTQPAFACARHDGNASNQLGFLWLVAAEIPVVHVLLHVMAGPGIAVAVTAVSVYGLAFLYAEYRATLLRPITLEAGHLHIRQGLLTDLAVPYSAIADVRAVNLRPRRTAGEWRLLAGGRAKVSVRLKSGTRLPTLLGEAEVTCIHLGVDEPQALMTALRARCCGGG